MTDRTCMSPRGSLAICLLVDDKVLTKLCGVIKKLKLLHFISNDSSPILRVVVLPLKKEKLLFLLPSNGVNNLNLMKKTYQVPSGIIL